MERKDNRYLVEIPVRDERGTIVERVQAVSFRGLLALAHEDGLSETKTEVVQFPNRENACTTVVVATVRTKRGTFSGIGDANPENVGSEVRVHAIRCAETRALARALRVALSIGEVSDVEVVSRASAATTERHPPPPVVPRLPDTAHVRPSIRGRHEDVPHDSNHDDTRNGSSSAPKDAGQSHRRHIERFEQSFRGRDRAPAEAGPNGSRLAMSAEQRKYLFRLVYLVVPSKDLALERVLTALGVQRLEHATRSDAARAIDSLKEEIAARGVPRHTNGNGKASENGAGHA